MASNLATLITSRKCNLKHVPEAVIVYPDTEVAIGRSPKAELSFPGVKQISHEHCYVRNRMGVVEIKSVSSNRTFVCGKAIAKEQWLRLRDGDTVCLSQEPRVKFEVRIGSEVNMKGKRKSSRRSEGSVAEITSPIRPDFEYNVVPSSTQPHAVSVTIGRSKDCDVFVDNKKISSTHCKLIFSRSEDEGSSSVWNLLIECVSRNKTYIGSELIDENKRIEPFGEPVKICFVFPEGEKPVEVFTVTPVIDDSSSPEPLTASDIIKQEIEKEHKRQKKELHHLEKKSKEWESQYREGIEKLQDAEHKLQVEIDKMERQIKLKGADLASVREQVNRDELLLKEKEDGLNSQKEALRKLHEQKILSATSELNHTILKLQTLTAEKLDLQMGSPSKTN